MKRWMTSLIVLATVVAMTSSLALAQNEGGGRRGGRGGFGGGGFGGPGALLAIKEVQTELKLSEEDAKKITDKLAELRPQRGQGGGGNFRDFQNLSEEERAKRMEEFRVRAEENAKKVDEALKTLLTADQYQRLSELRLQRDGVAAIDRAEIAEKLKLSAEQKEKIKTIVAENRPRFGGGRGAGGPGAGAGGPPNMEEIRKRAEKLKTDVLAVLTPEQKETWTKLLGAEFKFPERQFGGPGAGGNRRNRPAAE